MVKSPREGTLEEIRIGLSQPAKRLPSKLFYDARGSALFEEITHLPEYYLTRIERALLDDNVPRWVADLRPRSLIELGSGSAVKARIILTAMRAHHDDPMYVPVDISASFLEQSGAELKAEFPRLTILPVATDFTRSLPLPPAVRHPALLTFLGSTIGNFTTPQAEALLRRMRAALDPRDRLLLGVDLRKDVAVLEAAYNDSRGVTAQFNRNVLRVINDRFGADFNLDRFEHRAVYDPEAHRIEMHLVSTTRQTVHVPGAGDFPLGRGEVIRTEISAKYDRNEVAELFEAAGLALLEWREDAQGYFAMALGEPATR